MDIDFHYHATYAAARFAGYSADEALTIASSAQMIDENGRHVLKMQSTGMTTGLLGMRDDFELRAQPQGSALHTFRVQMTFQGLGDIGSSATDTLASIWPVYHFLPGNFVPRALRTTEQSTLEDTARGGPPVVHSPLWATRTQGGSPGGDVQEKFRWLCRPHSPMAIGLINNCTDLVHDRSSQVYQHDLALYMVGVTMHVFIDTWAHQDFVGPASKAINGRVGAPSHGFAEAQAYRALPVTKKAGLALYTTFVDLGATLAQSEWKGCAPALATSESSNIYVGHGQVGHWPDHSALVWRYRPAWSAEEITRTNPVHYFDAFVHMVFAMLCIRNNRQYTPFEVNDRSLSALSALSNRAGGEGVALTSAALKVVNRLIQAKRDPWGKPGDVELPPQITDDWDKAIFAYGRVWQQAFREELFPEEDVTIDWVPGASPWVHEALQTYLGNKTVKGVPKGEWLTVGQFQSLDFFKFNLAAKLHYRFVKQQLIVFGERLIGDWADGAAFADDFQRVESTPDVRGYQPWRTKVLKVLGDRQRETKHRAIVEGMAILMSEVESASNAREAVLVLRRALSPSKRKKGGDDESSWTYGMEVDKSGALKHGKTYEAIDGLIKEMEQTNGFADMSAYLPLPTFAEWEKRSKVTFALRSSYPLLVAIDDALKETHRALQTAGLSNREAAIAHARRVVSACGAWWTSEGRDKRRDPAVEWLDRATSAWLEAEQL